MNESDEIIGYQVEVTRDNGDFFTLHDVIADDYVPNHPMRWFLLRDGARVEVPVPTTTVKFSPERNKAIAAGLARKEKEEQKQASKH